MSFYMEATQLTLQPEQSSQAAIVPDQFIMHSIAAPWTAERVYQYWRDSTNLESHFGLGFVGDLAQYLSTTVRADANYQANRRPNGHGAVSIETASNLQHTDPWTSAQLDRLVELGVWLHKRHGIPLRVCRSWDDPGYGYHRLYPEWSVGGTGCPGDARVKQFHDIVFPRIVAAATAPPPPQETDVTTILRKETSNTIDVDLTPGEWTGLAFGGATPAVVLNGGTAGINLISNLVHLSFAQTAPEEGVTVSGQYYLTDPDGSNASGYQDIGPRSGGGGHQFSHQVNVPAGKTLRFKVKVTRPELSPGVPDETPVTLLHRSESSRYWEV